MPNKELTPEILQALNEPLPKEAVAQHPTKPYLSTIKAIYVVERLNKVFGLNGWTQKNEVVEKDNKMVVVHSYLDVPAYGIHLDNFGGNDNIDKGDAYKGACTDALTKMAAYLGIGMDVFKGLKDSGSKDHAVEAKKEGVAPKTGIKNEAKYKTFIESTLKSYRLATPAQIEELNKQIRLLQRNNKIKVSDLKKLSEVREIRLAELTK